MRLLQGVGFVIKLPQCSLEVECLSSSDLL
jgi:hypothetical protein